MSVDNYRRPRNVAQTAWLDRLRHVNSDAGDNASMLFELMKDAAEFDVASIDFRHASAQTQTRQDRVLNDYCDFVRMFKQIGDDVDDAALDLACFPDPDGDQQPQCFEALWRLLRPYLYYVTAMKVPRSRAHKVVSYATLTQYRDALAFWIPRKYNARGIVPPLNRHNFNQMTEMLRSLAVHFKIVRLDHGPAGKSRIGLDDLRLLIDADTRDSVSIELSEQFHLAVCLGRACALRPGSLGPNKNARKQTPTGSDELPFLAWKDIKITRANKPGQWTLRVTIRNLKNTRDLKNTRQTDTGPASITKNVMRFRITSPQQQSNLALSVPHRLLVIGIRRGVFERITSLDELFEDESHAVIVKEDFHDQPIFIAGAPKGAGLAMDGRAMAAEAFTQWVRNRGEKMGWTTGVTFYSIRRQTADTYVQALGVEDARKLMSHDADSTVLERFYIDRLSLLDVSAATLGEQVGSGEADELMRLEASSGASLDRLPASAIIRAYGAELNALTRKYVRQDKDYLGLARSDKKNRERVHRRRAFLALREQMINMYRRKQTAKDREVRAQEMLYRATSFNKALVEAFSDGEAAPQDIDASLDDGNFDEDFAEEAGATGSDDPRTSVVFTNEQDAEDQTDLRDTTILIPEETQIDDAAVNFVEAAAGIPYHKAAKYAMKMMLDHELGTYQPQTDQPCPLCADDDTVDDEKKAKLWRSDHMRGHIASDFHTRNRQWARRIAQERDARMEVDGTDKAFYCPYCVKVAGDSNEFNAMKRLLSHVQRSNEANIAGVNTWTNPQTSAEHDRLKAADGWYDEDWDINLSENVQRGTSRRAKTALSLRKTNAKKLGPAKPVPGHRGIYYAAPGQRIGAEGDEVGPNIAFGPAPGEFGFEPSIRPLVPGIIADAPFPGTPGWTPMFSNRSPPPRGTVFVAFPGTEDNRPGDGHLISDWIKEI